MAFDRDGILQYSVDEVKAILRQKSARVIDVRTEEEYAEGHIPGVPRKTMQEMMDWMDELNRDEDYVFICRSGNRSQKVASYLKANGFSRIANMDGGMLAWDGELESDY